MLNMKNWVDSLDKDLISIVLPTYNRPASLSRCLAHIKNSIYKNLQIIVVDDGSSKENRELNKIFFNIYSVDTTNSKYIYLEKNTGGVSLPRNIGISYISGRTIAPTDDDCYPQPIKFFILRNVLWNNDGAMLAYGGRLEYDVNSEGNHQFKQYARCEFIEKNKTALGLDNGQFLYKADVYNHIDPVISVNACDYHLYTEFAPYGDFVFVDEPVCSYLWHGKNISLTPKPNRKDPSLLVKDYLDYFQDGPFKDKVKRKYCS